MLSAACGVLTIAPVLLDVAGYAVVSRCPPNLLLRSPSWARSTARLAARTSLQAGAHTNSLPRNPQRAQLADGGVATVDLRM
jgi:hypothetical protein